MTDTDNLTRRRFLQATGGAASAVALAGCTSDDSKDSGSNNYDFGDSKNKTLKLINSTMTTLDPVKATDTASGTVIQQVFDPLFNYPNAEIEVEPLLAKDYQISDDQTTYTVTLKEGAKFHNGDEVTASDVVYSWRRLAESNNSRRPYFILDSIGMVHEETTTTYTDQDGEEHEMTVATPNSLGVEATGDYTLEFQLDTPFHAVLEVLAYTSFAVIPEGIIGDIEGYDGEMEHGKFATENPIGAGPFKFESWRPDTEASVTRFDDYHREPAQIAGVHWNISSDANAKYTYGVQNQNADIVYAGQFMTSEYDPDNISDTSTDDMGRTVGKYDATSATMNYLGVSTISTYYMGFNTQAVPKPVRQAVAYVMNQQELVEKVFKGRGEPAYHFTPPMIYPGGPKKAQSHAENNYPYSYNETDIDKAKSVMEDAGYGENNQFSFEFTVYQSSDTWPDVAGQLRDKLQAAHVDMKINNAPFTSLLQRGRNGNLEAYSLGWVMDWPAPDNFLGLLYPPMTDTSKDAPQAYTNWSGTDAADQATQAWERIQNNIGPTDEEKSAREEAYVQMEEANWEDVVFLNVYNNLEERFSYQWVDAPKYGGAGYSRQMYDKVKIGTTDERNND